MEREEVFKNKEVLTANYTPETIQYRDQQIHALIHTIRSIEQETTPINLTLQGAYGTGKTTTAQKVLNEAENHYNNLHTLHLNCHNHNTSNKILIQVYNQLLGRNINSGINNTRLLTGILGELQEDYLIICLDEFHNIPRKQLNTLLYTLTRTQEHTENKTHITVWLITPYDWIQYIEPQANTTLQPLNIQYPNYTQEETYNILKNRVEKAFHKGVITKKELCRITGETKDIRQGLKKLREIGELKEMNI